MSASSEYRLRFPDLEIGRCAGAEGLLTLVEPARGRTPLNSMTGQLRDYVRAQRHHVAGILFRGFDVGTLNDFAAFVASCGGPLENYDYGSTPRSELGAGIYTSTEYPAKESIPLHNEQSYTRRWPLTVWFHCVKPAERGGETPLADSRQVWRKLPARLRQRFVERELLYVRNYTDRFDVPWQKVFHSADRAEVERQCKALGINCEWGPGHQTLRTSQRCQAALPHLVRDEMVWFNQAHLFHVSALDPEIRELLVDTLGYAGLPRNVYYGDGTPIEDSLLDEVRGVYEECAVSFPWQRSDILMLDNMLIAHGRAPFSGERRVVVAMSDVYDLSRPAKLETSSEGPVAEF